MNSRTFRTIIQKDTTGYHGYVPSLPGCHTQGRTIEETQLNLKQAIEGWIAARADLNWKVPEDSLIETLLTITLPSGRSTAAYA